MAAGFRLPPGIDDRAFAAADLVVIPHPRFGIDRLAHGAQQAQAAEVVLFEPFVAPLHEGADRGRRGVEDGDGVFLDDAPKAVVLRPVRRPLIHERGRAQCERAIDHVGVSRDPADIGGAPVHIVVAQIEDIFAGHLCVQQVTAGAVQDALRLAGAAAGVKDEERCFGIERHGRAACIDIFEFAVPPHIASFLDVHILARAAEHDDGLHRRVLPLQGVVHVLLQRHHGATTIAAVCGDDDGSAAVEYAVLDRLGAESAEDDAVHGSDAGAGQHGDRRLGNHGHVNDDPVALFHLVSLEHVGKAADFAMKLLIGQHALLTGFPLPDERCFRLQRAVQVTIEAVFADVELSAGEPLRIRALPVEHLGERLAPEQLLRFATEELFGVLQRLSVHRLVLSQALDAGLFHKFRRRFEHAVLDEEALVGTAGGFGGGLLFGGGFLAHDWVGSAIGGGQSRDWRGCHARRSCF